GEARHLAGNVGRVVNQLTEGAGRIAAGGGVVDGGGDGQLGLVDVQRVGKAGGEGVGGVVGHACQGEVVARVKRPLRTRRDAGHAGPEDVVARVQRPFRIRLGAAAGGAVVEGVADGAGGEAGEGAGHRGRVVDRLAQHAGRRLARGRVVDGGGNGQLGLVDVQ